MKTSFSNFKSTLLILSIVSATSASAQTKWNYVYDATGNRTQRVVSNVSNARRSMQSSSNTLISDGKTSVILQDGGDKLKIESLGSKEMNVTIYDLNGVELMSTHTNSQITNLDISSLRHGIYVLEIESDYEKKTYKFNK